MMRCASGHKSPLRRGALSQILLWAITFGKKYAPILHFPAGTCRRIAKIAIFGLAKSGTTGLWSSLIKSYPRRYLQFFEGQFLPSRYNKYLGWENPVNNPKHLINEEIIGSGFDVSYLDNYDKVIWLVRDPRDRLVSYILYYHYDNLYENKEFFRQQLRLLDQKEQDPDSVSLVQL